MSPNAMAYVVFTSHPFCSLSYRSLGRTTSEMWSPKEAEQCSLNLNRVEGSVFFLML